MSNFPIEPLLPSDADLEFARFVRENTLTFQELCDLLRIPPSLLGFASEDTTTGTDLVLAQRKQE